MPRSRVRKGPKEDKAKRKRAQLVLRSQRQERRMVMPRATVSTAPERVWLETLTDPEDPGFVDLRRMSYGELLQSQDMAFQIQVQAQQAGRNDPEMSAKVSQAAITNFQLALCIIDHNLEDESGRKLDFRQELDVRKLDPNVGQEIASKIDEIHNWKKSYPNSTTPSTSDLSTQNGLADQVASHPTTQQPDSSRTT